ncbi:RluA family pseudouridine synthase [Kordiimonas marina]|uniref:RluA family pseudouridine synthase n=1 Tax=Kordiimonas marina TaxID=2872312 RepID=UPI001FF16DFA|nr:RluA family pseudouridine synthase [Kordiimonas marina]MCJ9430541.1 RluA family pseudouridine synthase [Kordiimonas marina]
MTELVYNPPKEPFLDIVYKDDDLIVLNKPSGLLSVPGRGRAKRDSLAWRTQKDHRTATVVHRLDMETSGIMVMALNMEAHRHISRQFEERQTEKTYIAVVGGDLETDEGEIDLPLIVDWPNRPKHIVDHETGKKAVTRYRVLDRLGDRTRVSLHPITGRSHQLRVHMQSLGHPILGDTLYATPEQVAMAPRLQLHATELVLTHPVTGARLTFEVAPDF